jgi:3-hydroxybutyrate dehydrogenase
MENQIADLARTQGLPAQEVIEKIMLEPCAIKRLIEPEEVAEIVAFLCRDAGSAFSGVPMMIDLGSTAS